MSALRLQQTAQSVRKQGFVRVCLWPALLLVALLGGCASDPKVVPRATIDLPPPQPSSQPALDPARKRVVETAQNQIGRPYKYGGNGPRSFDCSGLVRFSYARAGISVPRTAVQQYRGAQRISSRYLQPGDLVFFDIGGPKISHVGIYVGGGRFVHAPSKGKQVSVESLDHPYWRERIVGTGHYFYNDQQAYITSDGR